MIAKTVEECWQIAFDAAEEYQEQLNNLNDIVWNSQKHLELAYNIIEAKRDAASLIARKIKFGEAVK